MNIPTRPRAIDPTKPPTLIPVGEHHFAIVDYDDAGWLKAFDWQPVKPHRTVYARANVSATGRKFHRLMHRMINLTPPNSVCHHRNRNGLDNRRFNLLNLSQEAHKLLHRNQTLLIKYDPNYRQIPDVAAHEVKKHPT